VGDGEAGSGLGLVLARVQLVLQIAIIKLVDEVVRARTQLHEEAVVFWRAAVMFPGLRRLGSIQQGWCGNGEFDSSTGSEDGSESHHD
jgi:hypothetical protein